MTWERGIEHASGKEFQIPVALYLPLQNNTKFYGLINLDIGSEWNIIEK